MTTDCGRSILVALSQKKKVTLNCCKPIGVLFPEFSFDAIEGIPIGYNSRNCEQF